MYVRSAANDRNNNFEMAKMQFVLESHIKKNKKEKNKMVL